MKTTRLASLLRSSDDDSTDTSRVSGAGMLSQSESSMRSSGTNNDSALSISAAPTPRHLAAVKALGRVVANSPMTNNTSTASSASSSMNRIAAIKPNQDDSRRRLQDNVNIHHVTDDDDDDDELVLVNNKQRISSSGSANYESDEYDRGEEPSDHRAKSSVSKDEESKLKSLISDDEDEEEDEDEDSGEGEEEDEDSNEDLIEIDEEAKTSKKPIRESSGKNAPQQKAARIVVESSEEEKEEEEEEEEFLVKKPIVRAVMSSEDEDELEDLSGPYKPKTNRVDESSSSSMASSRPSSSVSPKATVSLSSSSSSPLSTTTTTTTTDSPSPIGRPKSKPKIKTNKISTTDDEDDDEAKATPVRNNTSAARRKSRQSMTSTAAAAAIKSESRMPMKAEIVDLEQSFRKQMNLKNESSKVKNEDDDDVIELDTPPTVKPASTAKPTTSKSNVFGTPVVGVSPHMRREDKPVASWSPNFEKDRLESIKNKIKSNEQARQQAERKMQMQQSQQQQQQQQQPPQQSLQNLRYDAPMSSYMGNKFFNRDLSFEEQLKVLRENMIEVLASQPDPDKNYEGMRMPSGLKVKLLPHQMYSLKWLRWRENCYPNGSILADDMGLGKTLTILAYLKLQKDEKERMRHEKQRKNDDDDDDDEDEEEREDEEEEEEDELAALAKERRLKFKKKYGSHKSVASRYAPERLKTLIILPASLLYQWQSEISSKFEPHAFKVQVYHEANRKKYAANLDDNDIVFTTYEIVSREIDIIDSKDKSVAVRTNSSSPLARIKWKRVILDEAHRIKNHTTKVNKAVCLLEAKYRIAITGTPVHNSLTDFYSLVKFLRMQPLSDITLWNYLFPKEKNNAAALGLEQRQTDASIQRERRSNSWIILISNYILLRRTKEDKLNAHSEKPLVELPPKSIETICFKLNAPEKAIYTKIFKESKERVTKILLNQQRRAMGREVRGGGGNTSEIFVYLLRLRQACCHMSLLAECLDKEELQKIKLESEAGLNGMLEGMNLKDDTSMSSIDTSISSVSSSSSSTAGDLELDGIRDDIDLSECLKRNYMSSKSGKLIDMVDELLHSHPDDKMVIVSQWTSMLDIVGSLLAKRRIAYCEIRGDINLCERHNIVERFNADDDDDEGRPLRVMLLSLTAGGVGLNLVGANRMFLLDIHWNPALEQQCSDRIYRVGQKKPVTIYRFLTQSTIEEGILEVQKKKTSIAQKVCSANSAANGLNVNGSTNAKLTLNDFKLLFRDYDEEQRA